MLLEASRIAPMENKRIRRINVILLVRQMGNLSAFAAKVGSSSSYIVQCIGLKPRREIGEELARRIEDAYGKPKGWLDSLHLDQMHVVTADMIRDKLLELPFEKVNALAELLDVNNGDEHRGSLGRIRVDTDANKKLKGRVNTLKEK